MSVSKSFVQLPALLFFILVTWAGTHVWSSDFINTYIVTPEGGESSTLSVRERSKDGAHLLLSELRSDAGQQEAGQQEAASAVINPRRGVTRLIPDVNHSGNSTENPNSHRVVYHPPSSEINPLDPAAIYERNVWLSDVTIPSFNVLRWLSSSPVKGVNRIILALPLPARITHLHPGLPKILCVLRVNIRQPVVTRRDDSTFIVEGNVLLGGIEANSPLGPFDREVGGNGTPTELSAEALFTYNPADDSVQLREFRVTRLITIIHTDSRETNEHDGDMESFWLQLERYQEQQPGKAEQAKQQELRKAKQQEYINGLEVRERQQLRGLISWRQLWGETEYDDLLELLPVYSDYLTFMASLDNEVPVNSTPEGNVADNTVNRSRLSDQEHSAYAAIYLAGWSDVSLYYDALVRLTADGNNAGDTLDRARLSNQERAVYLTRSLARQGYRYDENAHIVRSTPEGGDAGMEFESGTAGNDSLSNVPANQPIELLRGGRAQLSFGVQSHSK